MTEIISRAPTVEGSEIAMKLGTSLAIGSATLAIVAGGSIFLYNEYHQMKARVAELESKIQTTESVAKAQSQSGDIKDEQAKSTIEATAATSKLVNDVASLRKSVRNLEQRSQTSLSSCQQSLTVAGEISAECAERYSALAGKAEQMKIDHIATEKHVDVLEGLLSDISGLGPLK